MEKKEITSRFANALIFMIAFIVIGWGLPTIIERSIPTRYYYSVETPALVGKTTYHPGEQVIIILSRESRINVGASEIVELTLVDTTGDTAVQTVQRPLNIEEGRKTIKLLVEVPKDAPPGEYFIQATVIFETKEIKRHVPFFTEHFSIEPLEEA